MYVIPSIHGMISYQIGLYGSEKSGKQNCQQEEKYQEALDLVKSL